MTGPQLWNAEQIWTAFGVPRGTLKRWRHEGRLIKYGDRRQALYDPDEVEQLVEYLARST